MIRGERERKRYKANRLLVLKKLGGQCVICGFSDYRALQIDHINGGGNKHRKEKRVNSAAYLYYQEVINDINNNYQLLCANCNWIKRYENNELGGK